MKKQVFDIKKQLKKRGMSVQDLATLMQVNRVTISKTLNGNPTIETLEKIAGAIGCEVKDFFCDNNDSNLSSLL